MAQHGEPSVLYCTVLYCTVLYCTVLYCNVVLQVRLQTVFHRPFPGLTAATHEARTLEIRGVVKQGHYREAVRLGYAYIDTVMEGIEYYQRYQQAILLLLIKVSLIGEHEVVQSRRRPLLGPSPG